MGHQAKSRHYSSYSCVRQDGTRWFQNIIVVTAEGNQEREPQGPLCFVCGHSVDSFRPLTYEEVRNKFYRNENGFRAEFSVVQAAVERSSEALEKQIQAESIRQERSLRLRVHVQVAAIPVDLFAIMFGVPAKDVGVAKIVKVPSPEDGSEIDAVLMRLADVPPRVPHYTVELSTSSSLRMDSILLSPETIVRKGQAEDEYSVRAGMLVKERLPVFKGDPPVDALTPTLM